MGDYDSTQDTLAHIGAVRANLGLFVREIARRALAHDKSKLQSPEKEVFDRVTPRMRGLTYGSPEYKACLTELGEALAHHYANNSHHPEFYENGVAGMTLVDLLEMFADWAAAVKRHADGDLGKSIEINGGRFAMSEQIVSIFENTRVWLESQTPP